MQMSWTFFSLPGAGCIFSVPHRIGASSGPSLLRRPGEKRSENGQEKYVGGRHGTKLRLDSQAQAYNNTGKLTTGDQGSAGAKAPSPIYTCLACSPVTCHQLCESCCQSQGHCQWDHSRKRGRINLQPEEEEERRRAIASRYGCPEEEDVVKGLALVVVTATKHFSVVTHSREVDNAAAVWDACLFGAHARFSNSRAENGWNRRLWFNFDALLSSLRNPSFISSAIYGVPEQNCAM
jgi:hypothetical protein